jgi:hypothetical protein
MHFRGASAVSRFEGALMNSEAVRDLRQRNILVLKSPGAVSIFRYSKGVKRL